MRTPKGLVAVIAVCTATLVCCAEPVKPVKQSPGLSVRRGVLLLKGKPWSGVGVNYFSLFYRRLKKPGDASYRKGLQQLSEAKIPFVRFMACGFWPIDWELYLRDKEAYFKLLDGVELGRDRARAIHPRTRSLHPQRRVLGQLHILRRAVEETHRQDLTPKRFYHRGAEFTGVLYVGVLVCQPL